MGHNPLKGTFFAKSEAHPLYGLSEVFTVVSPAAIQEVKIVSDPGRDGNYETGDDIEVAVTFGEAVDVSGTPRVKLRLGETADSERWAEYDANILVKNTGQPQFSGTALTDARPRLAQGFRTGTGGYELQAVGIKFHTISNPATAASDLTVTLHAGEGGNPAATPLCMLDAPAEFGATGLQTFDAPDACPDLAGGTDYYVVVERVSFSAADTIAVWHTASPREDAGAASGWSIGDSGHTDSGQTGASSWSDGGAAFLVKVKGELPAIYRNGVLISNTGQADQAGVSWVKSVPKFGQEFRTGANNLGYRLSEIGISMGTITDPATVADLLRVTLNADLYEIPGSVVVCTFSPPASFSANAVNRFNASSCPALAPNTDYWVVVERLAFDTEVIEWISTNSRADDAGAAAGWGLTYDSILFVTDDGWGGTGQGVFEISVRGRALLREEPPEPPEQPRKQVANTGQTGSVAFDLGTLRTKQAQAFTTGSHTRGYELGSIGIGFATVTAPFLADNQVTVTLHAGGSADPGTLLCTLLNPRSIQSNAVATFTAKGNCSTLMPNTTYFVVVERHTVTSTNIITAATPSDGEDSGSRPGWSIADDSRVFDGTNWAGASGNSLTIDIRAVDLPDVQEQDEELVPGPKRNLVSNTGQTRDGVENLRGNFTKVAQKFTTGTVPGGYRLGSVGLHFDAVSTRTPSATTVTLNADASGEPGAALCTLTRPSSFISNAVLTYSAPTSDAETCPTLSAAATYFVVVEQDVSNAFLTISATSSAAEDDGSAPGWSIAHTFHFFNSSTGMWGETAGFSIQSRSRAPSSYPSCRWRSSSRPRCRSRTPRRRYTASELSW